MSMSKYASSAHRRAAMREKVRHIALEVGGELRTDYSGRGMYGATCYGIVTNDATFCIETAAEHGVKGASVDSMGTKVIVYWQSIHDERSDAARGKE